MTQTLEQRPLTYHRSPSRTLVLNAGFEPLSVVSFRRALVLVMNNRAAVVEVDRENPVWTVAGPLDRPTVIVLTRYVKLPRQRQVPVSGGGCCGAIAPAVLTASSTRPRLTTFYPAPAGERTPGKTWSPVA